MLKIELDIEPELAGVEFLDPKTGPDPRKVDTSGVGPLFNNTNELQQTLKQAESAGADFAD